MLKSLNIRNFAVIQSLEVNFHEGLNLLTGETGSGKSIIIDALGLLLGGRSSVTQIRTGEDIAVVEGVFTLKGKKSLEVSRFLAKDGIGENTSDELLVRRELSVNNRNRILVNGKAASISTLRALQKFLVDIHGQGEQRALLSTQSHLELLDQFADCLLLRQQLAKGYLRWRTAKEALTQLENEASERDRQREFLQYQLSEIEFLDPKPNEDEELQAERRILTHAETAIHLASGSYLELYESETSILSRIATVRKSLEELSKIDGRFGPATEVLEQSVLLLTEVADLLRSYGVNVDFAPMRLDEVEARLAELEKVKRKFNSDLQGTLNILHDLSERLDYLNSVADKEPVLRAALQGAEASYRELASKLSECRHRAKEKFEQRVMSDLRHVAMENAQFIIAFSNADHSEADNYSDISSSRAVKDDSSHFFSPFGMDQVEFLLSANPGESPRPLAHVASGGELSRLMLTLRTIGTVRKGPQQGGDTVIFDEVDTGIGGRVAEAVGRRLKRLAATKQVLCVTHQPPIARFADHHYAVEKSVVRGRTGTVVKELNLDERIGELARMIGGDEQSRTARETANWLLDNAGKNMGGSPRMKKSSKL